MDWPVIEIILTGLLTLLASSGFWSYRLKKLERKYELTDKKEETTKKLDKVIETQSDIIAKIDKLTEDFRKSNEVTMAVARDRIYYLCKKLVKEKNCDPDNMRDLKSLFVPYKANDGNGIADEYFERYEHMYKMGGDVNG